LPGLFAVGFNTLPNLRVSACRGSTNKIIISRELSRIFQNKLPDSVVSSNIPAEYLQQLKEK
jgi:hypothetical protein